MPKTLNHNAYRRQYLSLVKKIEEIYVDDMTRAVKSQYGAIIDALKDRGVVQAIQVTQNLVFNTKVTIQLERLFKFAIPELAYWKLRKVLQLITVAEGRELGIYKDDSAAFGLDEGWNQSITDFLNQYILRKAVVPITDTTKQMVLEVLRTGQQEGWSIERIVTEITNQNNELSPMRARRIVRTEITIAANFANKLVGDSIPFECLKVWISSHDHRVRESHRQMDGVEVDEDYSFQVPIIKKKQQIGIDLMSGPGDPEATAGNIINCRCTLALNPKRNDQGRLIKKRNGRMFVSTQNFNKL